MIQILEKDAMITCRSSLDTSPTMGNYSPREETCTLRSQTRGQCLSSQTPALSHGPGWSWRDRTPGEHYPRERDAGLVRELILQGVVDRPRTGPKNRPCGFRLLNRVEGLDGIGSRLTRGESTRCSNL